MRATLIPVVLTACLASSPALMPQTTAPDEKKPAKTVTRAKTPQELNIEEYINLLRQDVSAQKAKLLGAVMQFDAEDAAKFWPIYRDYDAELKRVNNLRVANIMEYSRSYATLTDQKADALVRDAMAYRKKRDELLAKYYELVRQALGGITAARFLQVEQQLLTIIDLKIASSLPLATS